MFRPRIRLRTVLLLVVLISLPIWLVCRLAQLLGTEYAPGYSEAHFFAVAIGDQTQQVESLLGKPLRVTSGGSVVTTGNRIVTDAIRYEYSRSPIDGDYEVRDVWFDAAGRVVDKWHHHWYD